MRLSHSASSTYATCPYKYSLRYIHKLRPTTMRSSLLFGNAIDKGLNDILLKKSDGVLTFIDAFSNYELNGTEHAVCGNPLFVFSQTDFDHEIFTELDLQEVNCSNQSEVGSYYTEFLRGKKENTLTASELAYLNKLYWISLKRKGLMMLEAYSVQVMPLIKNVLDIQREISVTNGEGDSITGFVDLIAELHDGRRVIFDNKTSGEAYKDDSVVTSDQLSLYCFALENIFKTRHCGFIVMSKKIKKQRKSKVITPYVDIQIIINEMPQEREEAIVKSFDETSASIKAESFDKNMGGCYAFGKCEYFNFCHKNDPAELVKIEYINEKPVV